MKISRRNEQNQCCLDKLSWPNQDKGATSATSLEHAAGVKAATVDSRDDENEDEDDDEEEDETVGTCSDSCSPSPKLKDDGDSTTAVNSGGGGGASGGDTTDGAPFAGTAADKTNTLLPLEKAVSFCLPKAMFALLLRLVTSLLRKCAFKCHSSSSGKSNARPQPASGHVFGSTPECMLTWRCSHWRPLRAAVLV